MTVCDIAAITKPWEIQRVVAELVASEFFQQGDIEKTELNLEPIVSMTKINKKRIKIKNIIYDAASMRSSALHSSLRRCLWTQIKIK